MKLMIESTVQNAAIEWLQNLGYRHQEGNSLQRELKKVVLEDDLRAFLQSTYPELPATAISEALSAFTQHEGMDVDHRNRDFHRKMTQGIAISWKDAQDKEYARHIYPINFAEPDKNSFVCADEVKIEGKNNRRCDLLIFINGLPVVVFEFKNAFDANVGIDNAHGQIGHYLLDIPQLFDYNAITILSDGMQALHGMYNAAMEWFAPWKSLQGTDTRQKVELQLETLLYGLFPKARLLNYLQHFIFHEDHNGHIIKKGAKYHQYWGICKAVESARSNIKPLGDGRLGVIWHTQGSGKSISMAILTGILRSLPELKNPTLVIQVDRSDLDQQLYESFVLCKDLVGDVQHADTTDELRELLSAEGGGVIFTTIEKFRLKELEEGKEVAHPVLSTRYNLIVMADEAHRTQYGFKDGGFAQNIRKAMPNASFIGFTGTPVDGKGADTELVFGETIHTYDIKQAVEDGATVPIYYEPKMVPLNIKAQYSQALDAIEEEEDESTQMVWAAIEDAAGAEDRVKTVASEIVKHYQARTAALPGKAMIVCMSRKNCVKMYDAITALEGCPEIAVIMTSNIGKDPVDWNPHVRTKDHMEAIKKRFRTPGDPLKIVIVRDMWLTGFDAPCAHTMYVDKIMKGHNLMQAIARVNRVFGDKPNGLVVDFIGISDFLAQATKKYTGSGGEGKPTIDIEAAVHLCLQQLASVKALLGHFDLESINALSAGDRMKWSEALVNDLLQTDALTDAFLREERKLTELVAMTNSDERIWAIHEDIAVVQAFREAIRKIKVPPGPQRKKNERIKDLISKSIESHSIVDLASMYDLDKIDISIIDDRFQAMVKDKGSENIKVELLRRIINDELKVRMAKNIKKTRKLKEELEAVLSKYHKNSLDSIAAIKHLLDIATEFKEDDKRTKELGLSEDELAFYDLLSANGKLLNTQGPIQDLVHKVVASVKKNLQLDWAKKEEARAAIRLAVKKELKGKVPFSELDQILKEVIEQAEGQYADWPMVG
ncbi:type I restriction endonuclease subunit R [Ancylomarina euxinus]|uniref:Type I restriction enzyme endonuclease subunit n=1 Tax=Ancylomarina euxinus TaxID=2283627 RepID=A0A425Y4B2_9BACT|nr:type I restriction endonuclease subunit R [Ancylomarina euxinus]MCZ4694584.1 type I restriction endonuclease subunit R [Ancylomarina euxinus]MUP14127.1 HsdR family type I site-specific deoxyribonuclease [Ancylomarina euxinus]RRG22981.1 type I restriction endonuclease subunit R [Ancylomarina euxinus]